MEVIMKVVPTSEQQPSFHSKEPVQKVLKNFQSREIEDTIDIQGFTLNEAFSHNYLFKGETGRSFCFEYIEDIDPNYDEGYFLTIAAREGDSEMLQTLIEIGANVNIDNESALTAAANSKYKDCIKLLISKGANPDKLKFTTAYPIIQKCLQEMQSQES